MNQILNTNQKNNSDFEKISPLNSPMQKKNKFLNLQLVLSILAILALVFYFFYRIFLLQKQEQFSNLLKNNYNLSKLYPNIEQNSNLNTDTSFLSTANSILGVIKIPKLNISYTFFSGLSDDLLKISPCRFYGDLPNTSNINKNLCIAGHNYNNKKFFSQINKLEIDDKIIIIDNSNNEYIFSVIKNYEVKSNDLSPIYTNLSHGPEVTLVTCNNMNNNRIIVKASL